MSLYDEQRSTIRLHQQEWPVQTVPIAQALGISVYRVPGWPNDVSGMIRKSEEDGGNSGYAIYVNGDHPEVRRRFTIAHEIGHFVLHKSLIGDGIVEDGLMRAQGFSSRVEYQANQFAADLLMPWHLINRAKKQGIASVEQLARAFNVSNDAMSIRLYKVQYKDSGVGFAQIAR